MDHISNRPKNDKIPLNKYKITTPLFSPQNIQTTPPPPKKKNNTKMVPRFLSSKYASELVLSSFLYF
jgi:hypothetical protein